METVTIVLNDGFRFNATLNGNNYLPMTNVSDSELKDSNLAKITIEGKEYKNMHCANHFIDEDGEHIVFGQISESEVKMNTLEQAVQDLILAQMGGK